MRILIATDAWLPQVNGVVTTIINTVRELRALGHEVGLVTHEGFRTFPCPSYPEIRLAVAPGARVARMVDEFEPDAVHVATEAPLGLAVRRHCLARGVPFTTAFHTQIPEYVHARCRLPVAITYRWLRWFHGPRRGGHGAHAGGAPPADVTRLHEPRLLVARRRRRTVRAGAARSAARSPRRYSCTPAGWPSRRTSKRFSRSTCREQNGSSATARARACLEERFPDAVFHGVQHGQALAHYYQQADVFVFPSRTDTFGLVMIEAMACGTPVAAYPVTGPIDVVRDPAAGVLSVDLRAAARAALDLERTAVRRHALKFSWTAATRQFVENLSPARTSPDIVRAA